MAAGSNQEESKGMTFESKAKNAKGVKMKNGAKKSSSSALPYSVQEEAPEPPEPIEYPYEYIFSDLMPYMMQYVQALRHPLHIGMWRSQLSVLKAFNKHCKQFFMPEFHEEMWDITFDMAIRGTSEIKEEAG